MAFSAGAGAGSSNSSVSWVSTAGTAPYSSNQCFAAAISCGVSGQSFQPPKGRYAKTSQGFFTGTFARMRGEVLRLNGSQ